MTKTLYEKASRVIYSIPNVAETNVKNKTKSILIKDNISMCITQFITISSHNGILHKAHVVQMCSLNIKYNVKKHIDAKHTIDNSNKQKKPRTPTKGYAVIKKKLKKK